MQTVQGQTAQYFYTFDKGDLWTHLAHWVPLWSDLLHSQNSGIWSLQSLGSQSNRYFLWIMLGIMGKYTWLAWLPKSLSDPVNTNSIDLGGKWDILDFNIGDRSPTLIPGDGMKRNPERDNFAILPIASRQAHLIHIRVTVDSVTPYIHRISSACGRSFVCFCFWPSQQA